MMHLPKSRPIRWPAVCILACGLLPWRISLAASFPDTYDEYFRFAAARWTPRPYAALKAQGWQESRLKPDAVSPAGAAGVMQIMRPAWGECQKALRFSASRFTAKMSIYCGGWYMQRMDRIWDRRGRTQAQVWPLSLASYNAGAGWIIKAQARCGDPLEWPQIAPCLSAYTGGHALETIRYAVLVPQWYRDLQADIDAPAESAPIHLDDALLAPSAGQCGH